jgi:hypothetical protein
MARKPLPSPDPAAEIELASAIHRLTDMLGIVDETLRDIKDSMAWVINNRDEFLAHQGAQTTPIEMRQRAATDKPEIIACTDCDTDSPRSLAAALQAGWSELALHDGPEWNYIGLCPDCLEREYSLDHTKREEPSPEPSAGEVQSELGKSQGTLF